MQDFDGQIEAQRARIADNRAQIDALAAEAQALAESGLFHRGRGGRQARAA